MCSQNEVQAIIRELGDHLRVLFPQEQFEIILFGSYARGQAEDDSDIDVLFLVDASRQSIAEKHWRIGEAAAELLMAHGTVVSPIVENRDYFESHSSLLPFYQNILQEGVRVSA